MPSWLGWILENPFTDAVAGSHTLLIRADVRVGMRVLDIGAGPGRVAIPAAEKIGATGAVVAVDVQDEMVARLRHRAAERRLGNITAVTGPIESLVGSPSIPESSFDRALLVTVLGEIPDREIAMRAIHAVLRPGGILSVTEYLPDPHFMTRRTVRRLAESAGFQLDREFGWPVAFTMNFRKS